MISNKPTVAGGSGPTLIPHPITHLCSHTEFEKRGRFFIDKPKQKYKSNGKRASSMPAYKDRGQPQKEGQLEQGNTKWDPIVRKIRQKLKEMFNQAKLSKKQKNGKN